jgi:hypothetical protein
MISQPKTLTPTVEEAPKTSVPMSTYVLVEVEQCIKEDAAADDRSESYIIARILKAYYARRIAKKSAQPQQRRAA